MLVIGSWFVCRRHADDSAPGHALRNHHLARAAGVLLCVLVSGTAHGQTRTFADLRRAVSQAPADDTLQLRVHWLLDQPVVRPTSTGNRFDLTSIERLSSPLSRDRRPEVSLESLVVVSEDAAGGELDWRIAADPRVVRSETPTLGVLRGATLYYQDVDLILAVPALAATSSLAIYDVTSIDGVAALTLIGRIDLSSSRPAQR